MLILLYCIIEKDTVHFGININFFHVFIFFFSGKLHFIHIFIAKNIIGRKLTYKFLFSEKGFSRGEFLLILGNNE